MFTLTSSDSIMEDWKRCENALTWRRKGKCISSQSLVWRGVLTTSCSVRLNAVGQTAPALWILPSYPQHKSVEGPKLTLALHEPSRCSMSNSRLNLQSLHFFRRDDWVQLQWQYQQELRVRICCMLVVNIEKNKGKLENKSFILERLTVASEG